MQTDRRSVGRRKDMRIVKDGGERRKELLDTARRLFISKGYEKTSINDILKEVGIAKGTFYYYFTSKEEMLEAMILDIVKEGAERAKVILHDNSTPILVRMLFALQVQTPEIEGAEMIHAEMMKPENAKLDQLYLRTMIRELTDIMLTPIQEAIDQGIMKTDYPKEGIEIVLLLAQEMLNRPTFDWGEAEESKKMQVFLYHVQRILGIREEEIQQLFMMLRGSMV